MNFKNYIYILLSGVFVYLVLSPKNTHLDSNAAIKSENEVLAVKSNEPEVSTNKNEKKIENTPAVFNENIDLKETRRKKFNEFLSQITSCLDIKNTMDGASLDPKIDNLINSVQAEIGDPVIRSQDWSSTEIKTSKGEKKLIKIETIYEAENIVRRLKYYNVTDKGLESIDLTEEQSVEPSDTLIASLESEGTVTKREKSERIFFQNSEEIYFNEQDNEIQFVEFSRMGKSLKCKDFSDPKSYCQCK